ncbi:hypothetical protein KZ326_08070, partial [Glaesserella parasuis]|nr:hypothetical protein [Glaesserella parasuis]
IEKSSKAEFIPLQQTYLNIIADVTFFSREFGVLVLMDTLAKKSRLSPCYQNRKRLLLQTRIEHTS